MLRSPSRPVGIPAVLHSYKSESLLLPIPPHFYIAWSVCLSSVSLSVCLSVTIVHPFYTVRHISNVIQQVERVIGSSDTLCQMRSVTLRGG